MSRYLKRNRMPLAAVLAAFALHAPAAVACWEQVGQKYNINPYLLYAMAKTESGLNPRAVNRSNANGSYDIGLMQINSRWLTTLQRHGISEKDLFDPCVSIEVGAWILAQNMRRLGHNWNAVGAYNAASADKRVRYALSVYRNLPPALRPQPEQRNAESPAP